MLKTTESLVRESATAVGEVESDQDSTTVEVAETTGVKESVVSVESAEQSPSSSSSSSVELFVSEVEVVEGAGATT